MSNPTPMDSTILSSGNYGSRVLAMLIAENRAREEIVARAVRDEARWAAIRAGTATLTFPELAQALRVLKIHGHEIVPDPALKGPFGEAGFYNSLREDFEDAESIKEQLRLLREETGGQKGFLKTIFNIFSAENPLDKVVADIGSFALYCDENDIAFDDVRDQLVAHPKQKTFIGKTAEKIHEFRFLVAAAAGGALGFAGINLTNEIAQTSYLPQAAADALSATPDFFFKALPWIAMPYITLNVFRAFADKEFQAQDLKIGTRFGVTMALGAAIGLGLTTALSGYLPHFDGAAVSQAAGMAGQGAEPGFTPSAYILHGLAGATAMAALYKYSKQKLSSAFNAVAAPVVGLGNALKKAGELGDHAFFGYLNVIGLPAITMIMSRTLSEGGMDKLSQYAGFYGIVAGCMGLCMAALAGVNYAMGARGKEFREMLKPVGTAFGTSSSAATMPVTKEALKNMGVDEPTRSAVVPLATSFQMVGVSSYLGVAATAAPYMFGMAPTWEQALMTMGLCVVSALGIPGAPASTVILLDPVLHKIGMTTPQAEKIYEMIMPADRIFDMGATTLNVAGDMTVALRTAQANKEKSGEKPQPWYRKYSPW